MNLPLNWLKQFVKIDATSEEIATKLTLSGSEVERIRRNDIDGKVVVGELVEIKKHPDADRLSVARVNIGHGAIQVIFGQRAVVKTGDLVPVAVAPVRLRGGEVKKSTIRGQVSEGMLCLDSELAPGAADILTYFPKGTKPGTNVVELLELNEPVLELEITPNRADCFSIRGLAREVAALFGGRVKSQESRVKEGKKKALSILSVAVKDKELCPKYTARVIENVTVKPSPLWLQNKLRQVGVKSINNIVDVTNYVMMELGQPLHAFDFDLLEPGSTRPSPLGKLGAGPWPSPKGEGVKRIVVRRAKKGEKLLALDGNTYNLNDSMLVIADQKKPLAIAGVMGGEGSGVTNETKTVVLEAAVFDSISVRQTSRELGLRSESSMRFEKGVDYAAIEEASNRAAAMMAELAGGKVLKGIISVETAAARRLNAAIKISTDEITRLLGVAIPAAKIKSILESLGFAVKPPLNHPLPPSLVKEGGKRQERVLTVVVPSWRPDVTQAADIVEEIGRMLDYNTLPKTLPSGAVQSPRPEPSYELRRQLRRRLTAAGYSEVMTYSFYDDKLRELSGVPVNNHILAANPVNAEHKYLRANLLPLMLSKLSQNSALLSRERFQLFEIGKIFSKSTSSAVERWQAAVGLIDVTASQEQLFRQLRGWLESFIGQRVSVTREGDNYAAKLGKQELGRIIVKPKGSVPVLRFRSAAAVLLLDLDAMLTVIPSERRTFKPLPYYPLVERDLAMIVPEAVQYKQIEAAMHKFDPLLKQAALFDVYHGLGEGTSLAFRLMFGSTDRTLEAREVDSVIDRLRTSLQKKFAVMFR